MSDRRRLLVITPEARSDIEQVLMYSEEVWGAAQSDRPEQSLYESLRRIRAFVSQSQWAGSNSVNSTLHGFSV